VTESIQSPGFVSPDRILLAEDDDGMRALLVGWLHEAGYDVTECKSGFDLLANLEKSVLSGEIPQFDVVLSDISPASAIDILGDFIGCDGFPPTLLITPFGDRRGPALASDLGAAAVMEKPFEKRRLMAELRRLRDRDAG
jgi:DNA-binding response OmpR family regulator